MLSDLSSATTTTTHRNFPGISPTYHTGGSRNETDAQKPESHSNHSMSKAAKSTKQRFRGFRVQRKSPMPRHRFIEYKSFYLRRGFELGSFTSRTFCQFDSAEGNVTRSP